MDQMTVCRV